MGIEVVEKERNGRKFKVEAKIFNPADGTVSNCLAVAGLMGTIALGS
jgi:hypothetical protein